MRFFLNWRWLTFLGHPVDCHGYTFQPNFSRISAGLHHAFGWYSEWPNLPEMLKIQSIYSCVSEFRLKYGWSETRHKFIKHKTDENDLNNWNFNVKYLLLNTCLFLFIKPTLTRMQSAQSKTYEFQSSRTMAKPYFTVIALECPNILAGRIRRLTQLYARGWWSWTRTIWATASSVESFQSSHLDTCFWEILNLLFALL